MGVVAGKPGAVGPDGGVGKQRARVFGQPGSSRAARVCGIGECWSGGGGERADAGERFGEGVARGPAGWEVKRVAPGGSWWLWLTLGPKAAT